MSVLRRHGIKTGQVLNQDRTSSILGLDLIWRGSNRVLDPDRTGSRSGQDQNRIRSGPGSGQDRISLESGAGRDST
jgi:hypothetical protein